MQFDGRWHHRLPHLEFWLALTDAAIAFAIQVQGMEPQTVSDGSAGFVIQVGTPQATKHSVVHLCIVYLHPSMAM
jgi:ABC-type taurine transport system ATPase subunit